MPEKFSVSVRREPSYAVVFTDGYINDKGGEKTADECFKLLSLGVKRLILNLDKSPVVNSLGIAALIRLIENIRLEGCRLVFCNCTDNIAKTFSIMGLTQFSEVHEDEKAAIEALDS